MNLEYGLREIGREEKFVIDPSIIPAIRNAKIVERQSYRNVKSLQERIRESR